MGMAVRKLPMPFSDLRKPAQDPANVANARNSTVFSQLFKLDWERPNDFLGIFVRATQQLRRLLRFVRGQGRTALNGRAGC